MNSKNLIQNLQVTPSFETASPGLSGRGKLVVV
jgi:hypothetical protein